MEFQTVIRRRKMVRSFEDRPVPDELVEQLVDNALRAPSGGFSQGWGFLVLRGRAECDRYWAAHKKPGGHEYAQFPLLFSAPVLIVCLSQRQAYVDRYDQPDKRPAGQPARDWPVPYWDIDTGMAGLLVLLTAVDLGLGALLFEVPRQDAVRDEFGIPSGHTIVGTIAVGYAAPPVGPPGSAGTRRRRERPVHYGQWAASDVAPE